MDDQKLNEALMHMYELGYDHGQDSHQKRVHELEILKQQIAATRAEIEVNRG